MANVQKPSQEQVFETGITPRRGYSLTTADNIGGFARTENSGPDLLEVVEEKIDQSDLIGHGTNNIPASATSPWIYVRTDDDNFFIKERTGAAEPYTYQYIGPFYEGSYESRIIYSAAGTPATPSITWNAINATFNLSGGDWAENTPNAKWWRLILLPKNSNAEIISPLVRIGDPSAADISVDASGFDGNLDSTDTDMQRVAQKIDDLSVSGGGGGSINQQPSDWNATTGVTRILNKPRVPQTFEIIPQDPNNILNSTDVGNPGRTVSGPFTIDSDIRTESSRYGLDIYVEANTQIELQETTGLTANLMFQFEILDASGTVVGSTDVPISTSGSSNAIGHARVFGNLPAGTERGSLRVTYVSRDPRPGIYQTLGVGWIRFFRGEIKSDIQADEVVIDPNAYGNNLRSDEGLDNVAEALDQVDELPVAFADDEDIAWDTSLDLSENLPGSRQQEIPVDQLIQDSNMRDRRQYVARINFHAAKTGGGGSTISYVLDIHGDSTLLSSPTGTVDSSGENNPSEFTIPSGTQNLRFTFKAPSSQGAARLNVTNFQVSIMEGVDTTGFIQTGRITSHNDRTLQSVAEKINAATAPQIAVDNTRFSNPSRVFGGLRDPVPSSAVGVSALPTNQREVNIKADYLLEKAKNFYHQTWKLHRNVSGDVYSSTFDLGSTTPSAVSEQVVIDPELRRYAIDADGDLELILHLSTTAVSADANITVGLWSATTGGTQYGDDFVLTGSSGTTGSRTIGGRAAIFRMTLPANNADSATDANVPANFYVRFTRTAGSATLTDGFIDIGRIGQEGASGGVGGGGESEWEVIWEAGPNFSDRLTTTSGSVLRNLKTGKRFDQFRTFMLQIDTNATAGVGLFVPAPEPAIKMMIDGTWTGNEGTWIQIKYGFYKLLRPHNQTSFYILGGSEIGYRKLWAI